MRNLPSLRKDDVLIVRCRAMLLRLFDDTGDIKDSTNKNHHTHRDAEVEMDEAEIASEADDVSAEETKGDAHVEEPNGGVAAEA